MKLWELKEKLETLMRETGLGDKEVKFFDVGFDPENNYNEYFAVNNAYWEDEDEVFYITAEPPTENDTPSTL